MKKLKTWVVASVYYWPGSFENEPNRYCRNGKQKTKKLMARLNRRLDTAGEKNY